MTKEPTHDDLKRFVKQNVRYCVSSLVYTLAQGYGNIPFVLGRDGNAAMGLRELTEQAFELSTPIDDYEEAAIQAGWKESRDKTWWYRGTKGVRLDQGGLVETATAQEACERDGIEPYQRDIYEHWIVGRWLAEKLEAKGERVDYDFAGLVVWGRTTTGQAILLDSVIADIWRDTHA